jgi:plasmid stabilization system protein ParE
MKPIRYLDAARREYENQIQFLIQNRSVAHALRFKEEVEKAEAEIQRKPDTFKLIGTYRSYGPTRKEKYRISYVETQPRSSLSLFTTRELPIPFIGSAARCPSGPDRALNRPPYIRGTMGDSRALTDRFRAALDFLRSWRRDVALI